MAHDVYDEWITPFYIFNKYEDSEACVATRGRSMYAGPHPELVSQAHIDTLRSFGWEPCNLHECFVRSLPDDL